MSRVRAKGPYYTTFRRKVRRWVVPVSREVPFEMVQVVIRGDLNRRKHTVDEASWDDASAYYTVGEMKDILYGAGATESHRQVSVRYVTGGMRHGLGGSIELQPQVSEIEFARAHNLPKQPPLSKTETSP